MAGKWSAWELVNQVEEPPKEMQEVKPEEVKVEPAPVIEEVKPL